MSQYTSVDHPFLKSATALGGGFGAQAVSAAPVVSNFTVFGIPIATMGDLAALAAFVYSVALTGEFVWRKFIRPLAENHKWLKRKFRRKDDQTRFDKYGI